MIKRIFILSVAGVLMLTAAAAFSRAEGHDSSAATPAARDVVRKFHDAQTNVIRDIKSAAVDKRQDLINNLKANRREMRAEIEVAKERAKEKAQEFREHYSELKRRDSNAKKIGVAHGKGLRMLNRFRSAVARFDHILKQLESRAEKMAAKGIDVSAVTMLIEEAKNTSVESAAKLEELKDKYELLLNGENVGGIAAEAREVANELKALVEDLHAKLREIHSALKSAITTEE